MPVITVNDQHYALRPGQNRLGAGADADVPISRDEALGVQAIVDVREAAHPVIRRAMPSAAVRVNGVELVDPAPLIHGDKVEIGGTELLYSDDTKVGATQFVSLSEIASIAATGDEGPSGPLTGGRLVSLVDGKEYHVGKGGLTIGRDAASAIVVPQNDVSRNHAVVLQADAGTYEVRDFSANGVFVNGKRISQRRVLAPSDLIRIGTEEFRFRADAAVVTPKATVQALPRATPRAQAGPAPAAAAPASSPPDQRRHLLATLQITNVGPTNGQQYEVRVPLAHIGRGAHNDVVLNDQSVSDSHAKLQRRDDGWYLIDLGSTNGTYVDGGRFSGERKLEAQRELRFGGVKMMFRPADLGVGTADLNSGTRAIAAVNRPQLYPTTSIPAVLIPPANQADEVGQPRRTVPIWAWGATVLAVAAAAAFLLLDS